MVNSKFKIRQRPLSGKGHVNQTIISCIFCFVSFAGLAAPADSLRIETINGKQFIIHQVDPKETLYSISRRYGVSVAMIIEQNPTADSGLAVGQQLKVPYVPKGNPEKGTVLHKVVAKETLFSIAKQYNLNIDDLKSWNNLKDNSISIGQELIVSKKIIQPVVKTIDPRKLRGTHTVTAKETLFSISKMYGASVQQLKEWNKLSTDEVKPGQMLFVLPPVTNFDTFKAEVKRTETPKTTNQEMKISETVIGSDEVHERGEAALMDGTDGNRKYLAQHKTVKAGTIMKVRSEATNREVFVRVIGPLNEDDSTVIKISKSAFDRLGAVDPKFRVEVVYYK